MLAHLRTEAYPLYRSEMFPGSPTPASRTIEGLSHTIETTQRRLGY